MRAPPETAQPDASSPRSTAASESTPVDLIGPVDVDELASLGAALPRMRAALPAARSTSFVDRLAATECPALTMRRARRRESSGAPQDPIVYAAAKGANVVDIDGNVYVDLTAGFGVAALGHGHPSLLDALDRQSRRLVHGLGDVHPSDVKVALLERLCALTDIGEARVILGSSGADAVEAAIKTAALATGKPGILAFEGAYHGLGYGPLAACGYAESFRAPFAYQLNPRVLFAPWPEPHDDAALSVARVADVWGSRDDLGLVLVEPILGRGGVRVPPAGFLAELAALAARRGALLCVDEVQTGLGRTGARLRFQTEAVRPDLVCVGKALGGGLPISACVGRESAMRAWGNPDREAIHTSTFLGHPLACAASLATLDAMDALDLPAMARDKGDRFRATLDAVASRHAKPPVRGAGLMLGFVVDDARETLRLVRALLEAGFITLPAGPNAEVIQLVPPLTIDDALLDAFAESLDALLTNARRTPREYALR